MIKMIRNFVNDESGATAIEYGLIAALIALVGVVAFTALGDTIADSFSEVAETLCTSAGGTYSLTAGGTNSCTFS
ncbi:Flp family type IVb pilin [Sneathiella glossodoripedis]|uniref:Flp family type IVb pilin n=1 Tax=Sneathiella glossodoripedis TaxID=418853 RepID=UPI0004717DFA|nr:Flp family type IVb pilin [Sneathiella glossodoripedis]